jgi:hypothetical protein
MNKFFFSEFKDFSDFNKFFIDTGDGGFQIFNNPLQGIIFAIYFQANINRFNSLNINTELAKIIGEINLRYTLTYGSVFEYTFKENYYGPAIIKNARIIAKDKLNRFLIDNNAYSWFKKNTNGIETLKVLNIDDLKNIEVVNDKDDKIETNSLLFANNKYDDNSIVDIDILKIGDTTSKYDIINIYSLYIQVFLHSSTEAKLNKFVISIGNLNTEGITNL